MPPSLGGRTTSPPGNLCWPAPTVNRCGGRGNARSRLADIGTAHGLKDRLQRAPRPGPGPGGPTVWVHPHSVSWVDDRPVQKISGSYVGPKADAGVERADLGGRACGIIRQTKFHTTTRGNLATRDVRHEDAVEGAENQVVRTAWWNEHMRLGASTRCGCDYRFSWQRHRQRWRTCRDRSFYDQQRSSLSHDHQLLAASQIRSAGQTVSDLVFTLSNAPGMLGATTASGQLATISGTGSVTNVSGDPERWLGQGPPRTAQVFSAFQVTPSRWRPSGVVSQVSCSCPPVRVSQMPMPL